MTRCQWEANIGAIICSLYPSHVIMCEQMLNARLVYKRFTTNMAAYMCGSYKCKVIETAIVIDIRVLICLIQPFLIRNWWLHAVVDGIWRFLSPHFRCFTGDYAPMVLREFGKVPTPKEVTYIYIYMQYRWLKRTFHKIVSALSFFLNLFLFLSD